MKELIFSLKIQDKVSFVGKLDSIQIAMKMREATAFLHASEYETFSVVCAEALVAGCPVVASKVGGIVEFVNENNGLLVIENKVGAWSTALETFSNNLYDRAKIAEEASLKFSSSKVGKKYFKVLSKVVNGFDR